MTINPDFIFREIAGEWLLVSIAEGEENKRLIYLNEIGKDIYLHLKNGLEGDSLIRTLEEEYEVEETELRRDVEEFLQMLKEQKVLVD